jgi:DinB superfamily
MHPQLEALVGEFGSASERLHALVATVPAERWGQRPEPDRWSIGECVAHLNLTAEAYLPLLEQAVREARRIGGPPPRRYWRDPVGWLLWRMAGPPVRHRTRTAASFIPSGQSPAATLVTTFDRLQAEQVRWVKAADGLPLGQVRVTSPFDARVRYNLYSCLTILPRHEHRHLWQAEQVWAKLGSS